MRIGDLASAAGVRTDTIRYYEREGLLPQPQRAHSGYRVYDATAIDRLLFIRGVQHIGLRLSDVRNLLAVRDTGTCPCEPASDLLSRRVAEVDAEIKRLLELRADMARMLSSLPGGDCAPPTPGTWCPPRLEEVTGMREQECCDDYRGCCPQGCC
jgi:DNA-binding transcriptional MerR regulator